MTTYVADGAVFSRANDASPPAYVAIAQVRAIGSVGQSRGLIDSTNLASTAREYKKGIQDGAEIELVMQYDPDDTGHAALRTDNDAATARSYRVTFTDSPAQTVTFSGLVTKWEISGIEIDSIMTLNCTIKPTSSLVYA